MQRINVVKVLSEIASCNFCRVCIPCEGKSKACFDLKTNVCKYLVLLFALFGPASQAQNHLFKDSWRNAGTWFKAASYESKDAWFWASSSVLVLTAISTDENIYNSLQLRSPNLQANLNPILEPWGHPVKMGSIALASYLAATVWPQSEVQGLSSVALQSMLTAGVVTMGLKLVFHRVRPNEQAKVDPYVFRGPSLDRSGLSFPSGHATTAFALAASISHYYDDPMYLSIPLYTLASLTAWQRVFDGHHWPSDVILGAAIGVFIGRKIASWQKMTSSNISLGPCRIPGASLGFNLSYKLDPIKD
jgi:membrane-associated phospholipid phosphatase